MRKFKTGDKVRIIKVRYSSYDHLVGSTRKIKYALDPECKNDYRLEGDMYIQEDQLELVDGTVKPSIEGVRVMYATSDRIILATILKELEKTYIVKTDEGHRIPWGKESTQFVFEEDRIKFNKPNKETDMGQTERRETAINETIAEVYTKTADAVLVTKYFSFNDVELIMLKTNKEFSAGILADAKARQKKADAKK